MKIKTSELEGKALDIAVAIALYPKSYLSGDRFRVRALVDGCEETIGSVFLSERSSITTEWAPSTDWSQGGPLIEGHPMQINARDHDFMAVPVSFDFASDYEIWEKVQFGRTPLIAACRAIVASKLGDEVEVPDVLL